MNLTSEPQSVSPGATALYCVVMGAILATAIFGNCLVLLAVKRTRSLRNTAAVLVVNLACVDLAVTVFIVPFVIVTASAHRWVLSTELCVATGFMNSFLTAAQIMALLHISLNRFLAVSYPHSYDTKLSKRLTLMMVAAGWVYAFFWTQMPFYGWGSIGYIDGTLFCNILWSRELSFSVTAQALCYFLPCLLAGVLYLLTYINVRKHWRRAKVRTQSTLSLGETNAAFAVTQSMDALNAPVTPSIEDMAIRPVTQPNGNPAGYVTQSTETIATPVTQSAENVTDPGTQPGLPVTQYAENETSQCLTQSSIVDTPQVTRQFAETASTHVMAGDTQHTTDAATDAVTQSAETIETSMEEQACSDIQSNETIASSIDDNSIQSSNSNDVAIVMQSSESLDVVTQSSREESPVTQSSEIPVKQYLDESTGRPQNGESLDVTTSVTQSSDEALVTQQNGTIMTGNVTQATKTSTAPQGNDTCVTTRCTENTSETESITQGNEIEPVTLANEVGSVTQANGTGSVTQPFGGDSVSQDNGEGTVTLCNGNGPVSQSNGAVVTDVTQSKGPVSNHIVHFTAASPHAVDMTFLEDGSLKASREAAKAARTRRRKRRAMENRVTKTLLGVAIAFAVCWFPRGVANLWALFAGRDKVPLALEFVSTAFVFLNSSVNPAIYGALNHDFYKAFISILSCQKAKRSRSETELGSGSYSYGRRI